MIEVGSRVQITGASDDDIPDGSLGTVADMFPGDDDKYVVIPDCRVTARLIYLGYELKEYLTEVAA